MMANGEELAIPGCAAPAPHETHRVWIWGASGHALVVASILRLGGHTVTGFLDDVNVHRHGAHFHHARILGGREQLPNLLASGHRSAIVAIGDNAVRAMLSNELRASQFTLVSALHPRAVIAPEVSIGAGTVIVAGAVINPGCVIGDFVIVNTSASVDHECVLEDGVHVGPGAHIGGGVAIGRGTWIGIGATVRDHVTIGSNSVIGAGAVVLQDVPSNVVAYGTPSKVQREHHALQK